MAAGAIALLAGCSAGDGESAGTTAAPGTAAPATTASTTAAPPLLPTLPPTTITALTGGDPEVFCTALDTTFPVVLILGDDAARAVDAPPVGEVALAPVLAPTLADLAGAAPVELAPPFVTWVERNRLALAAFDSLDVDDARVEEYAAAVNRELQALQDGTADETAFADLTALAAEFGIDPAALAEAAARFVAESGTFDQFSLVLGRDVTIDPAVQQELGQRFPCAADAAAEG